jgi:Tfp pilus assembly protein PilF
MTRRTTVAASLVAAALAAAPARAEGPAAAGGAGAAAGAAAALSVTQQVQALYEAGQQVARSNDWAGAAARWEQALKLDPANWAILNHYAWFLVDTVPPAQRDPDKALAMAARASELCGGTNRDVLDTVAEVWYVKGDFARAVEIGKKALEPGLQGRAKPEYFRKQLEKFEAAAAAPRPARR